MYSLYLSYSHANRNALLTLFSFHLWVSEHIQALSNKHSGCLLTSKHLMTVPAQGLHSAARYLWNWYGQCLLIFSLSSHYSWHQNYLLTKKKMCGARYNLHVVLCSKHCCQHVSINLIFTRHKAALTNIIFLYLQTLRYGCKVLKVVTSSPETETHMWIHLCW